MPSFLKLKNVLTTSSVEFVLSIIKCMGCIGFIILGIVIDCGGVGSRKFLVLSVLFFSK